MRSYTVHHKDTLRADLVSAGEEAVFVKEGFCWPVLFIPVLWLIYRKLWLALIGYVAAATAVAMATAMVTQAEIVATGTGLALNLVFGLVANDLRRWKFERQGLQLVGVVHGRTLEEAELRFFTSLIAGEDPVVSAPRHGPYSEETSAKGDFGSEPVLGLFPAPKPQPGKAS